MTQANTATTVTSSVSPSSLFGQNVTFTATVAVNSLGAGTTTGTVTFKDGGVSIGTGLLSAASPDVTTLTTSMLTVTGSPHTITAVYGGDTNFATNSGTLSGGQTVTKAGTTTTVISLPNPSMFGQTVTFTATATASSGTFDNGGTVTFSDGGTSLGTASFSSGQATLTAPSSVINVVNTHTITAVYGGDTNFTTSTSAVLLQPVVQTSLSMTVASSPNPSGFGQTVTFTATVLAASPVGHGDWYGHVQGRRRARWARRASAVARRPTPPRRR